MTDDIPEQPVVGPVKRVRIGTVRFTKDGGMEVVRAAAAGAADAPLAPKTAFAPAHGSAEGSESSTVPRAGQPPRSAERAGRRESERTNTPSVGAGGVPTTNPLTS